MDIAMKPGQSIRCGNWRIKFDPEWSPSKPYATFREGTAGVRFATVEAAISYFGAPASKWTAPG